MTVLGTSASSGPYTPNGSTAAFPFDFTAISGSEVLVVRRAADGTDTVLGGYSVVLDNVNGGGTVNFTDAPAAGDPIYILSDPSFEQQISFETQGKFSPKSLDEAFDRAAVRDIALKAQIDSLSEDLPAAAAAAVDAEATAAVNAAIAAANIGGVSTAISNIGTSLVDKMEAAYALRARESGTFSAAAVFTFGANGGWWDIQDLSTLFSDTAATAPATLNGPVAFVRDKSGNGNDLVGFGTSTSYPTLKQDGTTKAYYLDFDGVDDALHALFAFGAPSGNVAFERVSCIRQTAWTSDDYIFGGGTAFGGILIQRAASPTVTMFSGTDGPTASVTVGTDFTLSEKFYGSLSRIAVNNDPLGAIGSAGLTNPGGITIGSNHTTPRNYGNFRLYGLIMVDRQLNERQRGFARFAVTPRTISIPLVACFVGDSTVADNGFDQPALDTFFTDMTATDVAVPGNTIAQQKTAWQALSSGTRQSFRAVIIQAGLNDMDPSEAASVAITRLQDLVDTVRADVASACRIYISQMDPANGRWPTLWPTNPAGAQAKWLAMNQAIAGVGTDAIGNVDGRITSHVAQLGDANFNLIADYDESGDHIHPNYWGRRVNAFAIREVLAADGILRAN